MSQPGNASSQVLFACSRCYSRVPFEELSSGQQLCKKCRGDYPTVKCTYCRSEFQHSTKGSTTSICKKCEQNVKQYGKPSGCSYCNIIAAFIGNRCQRCTNSEKKYGAPVHCEQCKSKSAFDRKDENKKVDGKLLCWLCTLSYKRAVAKTKGSSDTRHSGHRNNGSAGGKNPGKRSITPTNSSNAHSKRPVRPDVTKMMNPPESSPQSKPISSSSNNAGSSAPDSSNSSNYSPSNSLDPVSNKKGSNSNDLSFSLHPDGSSSDHVVALTQLREQIASLQRQLTQKDKQLLDKDKQLTELKANNFTTENELRKKLNQQQRDHENKMEAMNKKLKTMQKEIATLSRSSNKGKSSLTIVSKSSNENNSSSSPLVKHEDDSN